MATASATYEPPAGIATTLQDLMDGNDRFVQMTLCITSACITTRPFNSHSNGVYSKRRGVGGGWGDLNKCKANPELVTQLAGGQAPKAVVLACSDSRSPPELIFDQGLGDLFIVRVAGNIVSPHVLGSILYAVSNLGSKLVVVLGHSKCGAVAATVDAFKGGNKGEADADDPISSLVACIHPVVHHCHTKHAGVGDAELKGEVAKQNSVHAAEAVSKCLAKKLPKEKQAEVTVAAAIYNIEHGKVDILELMPVGEQK